jgi:hypothetical protein
MHADRIDRERGRELAPAARADLDAVYQAMGASKVDSIQVSGTGFAYAVGQAFQPGQAWPKMNLVRYTRSDDYTKAAHSFDYTMTRAEVRGGGAIPQVGEARRTGGVSGDQAWSIVYLQGSAIQAPPAAFQHDLWTSPHGVVKAAMADRATMSGPTFQIVREGRFRAGRPSTARTSSRRSSPGSTIRCWATWRSSRPTATTGTTTA